MKTALGASGITGINFALQPSSELLERVAEAVADGRIVAPPITRISLEEAPAALRLGAGPTRQRQDGDHVMSHRPSPPVQDWLTGAAIGQVLPLHACTCHGDLKTACGERQ